MGKVRSRVGEAEHRREIAFVGRCTVRAMASTRSCSILLHIAKYHIVQMMEPECRGRRYGSRTFDSHAFGGGFVRDLRRERR